MNNKVTEYLSEQADKLQKECEEKIIELGLLKNKFSLNKEKLDEYCINGILFDCLNKEYYKEEVEHCFEKSKSYTLESELLTIKISVYETKIALLIKEIVSKRIDAQWCEK